MVGHNKEYRTWHFYIPLGSVLTAELYSLNKNIIDYKNHCVLVINKVKTNTKTYLRVPRGIDFLNFRGIKLLSCVSADWFNKRKLQSYVMLLSVTFVSYFSVFRLNMRVRGLGYKVYVLDNGSVISMKLGLSHIARFKLPNGYSAKSLGIKDRMFYMEGPSWIGLTTLAARVRSLRKIDVYRGKGIFKKFTTYTVRQSRRKKK